MPQTDVAERTSRQSWNPIAGPLSQDFLRETVVSGSREGGAPGAASVQDPLPGGEVWTFPTSPGSGRGQQRPESGQLCLPRSASQDRQDHWL